MKGKKEFWMIKHGQETVIKMHQNAQKRQRFYSLNCVGITFLGVRQYREYQVNFLYIYLHNTSKIQFKLLKIISLFLNLSC